MAGESTPWIWLADLMLVLQANGGWRSALDPGEPVIDTPRWSVTHEEGLILGRLAAGLRVLEIGTGLGVSTYYLAMTAQDIVTVDPDPWVHEHVWPLLTGSGAIHPRATWPHPDERFDAVFIDGCHRFDAVAHDIREARARVYPGGKLIFHDFNYHEIREAVLVAGLDVPEVYETANWIGVATV